MRRIAISSVPVLLALTGLVALAPVSPAAAAGTPWGTGCMPTPAGAVRTSKNCGATFVDGRAVPPPGAPPVVRQVIAAANRIDGRPYVWGGGHRSFVSRGYDCSGAVGYALHAGGLLATTMVSGQLEYWGEAGIGRWISVYANAEHVFMVVAGLRFDTRGDWPGVRGPRWKMGMPDPGTLAGFVVRHPPGL